MFKNHPKHHARSAGTSDKARIKVSSKLLAWADAVFVMERKHKQLVIRKFGDVLAGKPLIVLDIEDNYQFSDPELVEILKLALADYL